MGSPAGKLPRLCRFFYSFLFAPPRAFFVQRVRFFIPRASFAGPGVPFAGPMRCKSAGAELARKPRTKPEKRAKQAAAAPGGSPVGETRALRRWGDAMEKKGRSLFPAVPSGSRSRSTCALQGGSTGSRYLPWGPARELGGRGYRPGRGALPSPRRPRPSWQDKNAADEGPAVTPGVLRGKAGGGDGFAAGFAP